MSLITARYSGLGTAEYKKRKAYQRPAGNFLIVNPDYNQVWEDGRTRLSRNTRNGVSYGAVSGLAVPATARFSDDRFVVFTCDLQEWIHGLCSERAPNISEDRRKKDFASCFRDNVWMSNFAGTWTRQDCINGNNIGLGFPQLQPMATGGDLLKYVSETSKDYFIEAINPLDDYKQYHPGTHKWLFFEPKLSARYWTENQKKLVGTEAYNNDGHIDKTTPRQEWYQEPMHFYGENTIMAVWGFIPDTRSSTGWVNRVPKMRCRFLGDNESVPNPYIMRFGRSKKNPYEGF